MTNWMVFPKNAELEVLPGASQKGFGLAEFLISTLVLLIAASSIFGLIYEVQRKSSYQSEVQAVLNNTRLAIQMVGRYVRQAGNDPTGSGISGISIVSPSEVRIIADLTGSESPSNPDKGDPDGDANDSNENVSIRYNPATRSLEIVPDGGPAQIVAGYISGLSFRFYDSTGAPATTGKNICRINVTISGSSPLADPETHIPFGIQLSSDFQVAT
jgi:type II secretory pathway pseudopilin PulG